MDEVVVFDKKTAEGARLLLPIVAFADPTDSYIVRGPITKFWLSFFGSTDTGRIITLARRSSQYAVVLQSVYASLIHKSVPVRIHWLLPTNAILDLKEIVTHYSALELQHQIIMWVVESLIAFYHQFRSDATRPAGLLVGAVPNAPLVHIESIEVVQDIKNFLQTELTHYVQIGIKTVVCLINTRFVLYAQKDEFRMLNDGAPPFRAPAAPNQLIRIYYRLCEINTMKADDRSADNRAHTVYSFARQPEYANDLVLED